MNLKEGQPRPSRGSARHRRRVLAKARKEGGLTSLQTTIADIEQARRRLEEVQRESARIGGVIVQETVALEMEEIWLEFKLGRINQAERQSAVQRRLNTLEKEQPDIYNWLMGEDTNGETELARIRDKVFPPKRLGGYRVKR